jgi:hypothetical protein
LVGNRGFSPENSSTHGSQNGRTGIATRETPKIPDFKKDFASENRTFLFHFDTRIARKHDRFPQTSREGSASAEPDVFLPIVTTLSEFLRRNFARESTVDICGIVGFDGLENHLPTRIPPTLHIFVHEAIMISKSTLKIAALCGAFLLTGTTTAEALWPFCNWFGGYQGAPGYGTSTSYYGPTASYGYNPFAPLVPNPYCGSGCRTSFFGLGRNAWGSPCGCSPCGVGACDAGNCATGNCALSTTNQPLRPTPDDPPSTYDKEENPMDDPNFQKTSPDTEEEFPGLGRESFKVPMKDDDATGVGLPMDKTPPVEVKEEEKAGEPGTLEAPKPQSFSAPHLIDPRNSARLEEFQKLEHKITWRQEPVLIRSRPVIQASRPLVVRKTVRTGGSSTEAPLLSQSIAD